MYQQEEKADHQYQPVAAKKLALIALEEELEKETVKKYEKRMEEGYNCDTDQLYNTWKKLKQQCNRVPLGNLTNKSVPSAQKDLFQVPTTTPATSEKPTKSIRGTACLPKHISGNEVIKILEEKKAKKEMEERKKEEHQKQREERKKKKELEEQEKARKKEERLRQREERRKDKEREEREKAARKVQKKKKESKVINDSDDCKCPACGRVYIEDCETSETWIGCDICNSWYHLECTDVDARDVEEDFICKLCTS